MSTYLISHYYFSCIAIESHNVELPSNVSLQNGTLANKAKASPRFVGVGKHLLVRK
jgi:hypothetical protein